VTLGASLKTESKLNTLPDNDGGAQELDFRRSFGVRRKIVDTQLLEVIFSVKVNNSFSLPRVLCFS